jgi:hypothetical protein
MGPGENLMGPARRPLSRARVTGQPAACIGVDAHLSFTAHTGTLHAIHGLHQRTLT